LAGGLLHSATLRVALTLTTLPCGDTNGAAKIICFVFAPSTKIFFPSYKDPVVATVNQQPIPKHENAGFIPIDCIILPMPERAAADGICAGRSG